MMVTLKMRTRMETAETVIMRVRSRDICSGVTTAASTAAASCVSALTACSSGLLVSIVLQGSECPSVARNSVSADVCPAPRLRSDCPLCRGVPVRDRGPRHHRPAAAARPATRFYNVLISLVSACLLGVSL